MAPRGRHLASAAVLAATAVCAGVMVVRLSWAGPRPAALLADVCGRAQGSMLGQDALFNAATAALMLTISESSLEETMEAMDE